MADNIYKIVSGGTVTVVSGASVQDAAAKVGTSLTDPKTIIQRVNTGCYQPTLDEAKAKYEKQPVSDFGYQEPEPETTTTADQQTRDERLEPIPIQPATITQYEFRLPDGKVKTFEAMTPDEAQAYVQRWNASADTLNIIGTRDLSQYEIKQSLAGAASHSDMDYARALVKYDQVEGVVPVRDGKTREAMLIAEADWNALPKEYQTLVTTKGLDALNRTIYDSLPPQYQSLADTKDLPAAIQAYNDEVERANRIIDVLEPYKDGNTYDIVTPLQLGLVNRDDLIVAGFDPTDVKGVNSYVNKLSGLVNTWDKEAEDGTFLTSAGMSQGQLNDFTNAAVEAGIFRKYKIGDAGTEFFGMAPKELAAKWNTDITLEDKYNVAEIYAGYPAAGRMLASTYRGMITEAPQMSTVARFIKQFTLGGASATLKPFVKEQIKDNLQVMLAPYKEDGGYNITAYLREFPEDAGLLARGGIEPEALDAAMNGQKVVTEIKGASKSDWAVAGLIVTTIGTGGASFVVAQPAKSALIAASGLAQLGLGTYASIDTVKYWSQMDNTQRAIAISFDVLLLTSGALATRGGLRGFAREGGWLKLRNRIMYDYRAARNVIKKLLPSKKVEWIIADIDRAIRTGDAKLLKAAARQLELQAGKLPKQLGDPMIQRAKLLQAAPDDYIKLRDAPKEDIGKAIDSLSADIRAMESALRRVKDPKRYNTIQKALEKTIVDRERLRTQIATKQATKAAPFERVIWDKEAGKYVPAKTGTTTAVTKYKPAPAPAKPAVPVKTAAPETIEAGTKKKPIPIEEIRKRSPAEIGRRYGVSIWDISRATRKLPKGVQEEIALLSPEWAVIIKTKGATITETKTALRRNLQRLQEQEIKPVAVPTPAPATQTQPQKATKTQQKQKTKLLEKEALAIYPFFSIPQDVKTQYKRKRRTRDFGGGDIQDISARLPDDRRGIYTWKQGVFFVTGFPPYRPKDFIYTRKRPYYAETSTGRRSPQRTVKAVGGKVPRLVAVPMGVFTAHVKGGDVLTFAPRQRSMRRHKGRRRGRIIYS